MPPLDPRIAFLKTLLPSTVSPAPVDASSAQITPNTRSTVAANTNAAGVALAASPAGQFVKGFTGNPGTNYGDTNPAANFGDAVANATPAGGMSSGLEHLPGMITQGVHALPTLVAHAAPAIGAIGSMKMVGKDAKAVTPYLDKAIEEGANKVPMITKTKADPKAVASYLSVFDVPRRISQNMQVKPEQVIHQLVDDGITGVTSLDQLENHAQNITGKTGAFPQINNYILKQINTPINYNDALSSIKNLKQNVLAGEKPGFTNEVINEVNKAFEPVNYSYGDHKLGLTGQGQGSDLFQVSQNLRDIQRMYLRKSSTDMGELSHPEMDRAARAIMDIKRSVDDAIDTNVPPDVYQAFKNDPFVQEQLSRVPPKVAERFMQGATRFKDGQTIQAPYVNLQSMIDDTRDTQLSVWTKAAKAMQAQNISGNVKNIVGENTPAPKIVKNVVGGIAEAVAKPFDKSPEDLIREATSGKSPETNKKGLKGKDLKNIAIGTGLTALGGAIGTKLSQGDEHSNASSNNATNNPEQYHDRMIAHSPIDVKDIPQNQADIKIDSPVPHPSAIKGSNGSLAISDDQYNTTILDLQALKNDPSYQVFPKSAQLQAAIDAVTNKHAQSKPLLDKYEQVTSLDQKIADAKQLLTETSPSAWNALPRIGRITQKLQESFDPKYKQLMNDFNYIENTYPGVKGTLTNLGSKDSADKSLDQVRKMIRGDYYNTIHRFAGSESSGTSAQSTAQFQATQAGGLPPINGASIGGGSFQPMPVNPLLQQ